MQTKAAVALLLAILPACLFAADRPPAFTEPEIRAILAHGPWPMPFKADPSNRVSGKAEAIELGERLFFEPRLSASGRFSCSTCHIPERNWTDNLTRGVAAEPVERNTPTLMNVRLGRWFGWDGGADSLWAQSIRPILDRRELGATPAHVAALVRGDEQLACRYRKAFGAPPPAQDEAVLVDVAKALAAFQETFESARTPFDNFRDALARGGEPRDGYSDAARRGLRIFIGKGTCASCHSGPNFTGGGFADNGFPRRKGDVGRIEGVKRVRESRFNLVGAYNDAGERAIAAEKVRRSALEGAAGAFKIPTLRHLVLTPPYGHHGELDTLAQVVRHYAARFELSAGEQSDLVVFLQSIGNFSNPWRPEAHGVCR